jgi:hypothetical protein
VPNEYATQEEDDDEEISISHSIPPSREHSTPPSRERVAASSDSNFGADLGIETAAATEQGQAPQAADIYDDDGGLEFEAGPEVGAEVGDDHLEVDYSDLGEDPEPPPPGPLDLEPPPGAPPVSRAPSAGPP